MAKPTEKILLEVYKSTLGEEQFFTTLYENRVSFYSGLLSTIMTAIVLGIYSAKTLVEFSALLFAPIVLIFISLNGMDAAKRGTSRIYKILATRAKLEQALDLTQPQNYGSANPNAYWKSEPLVDVEHISLRKSYKTSAEFSAGGMKNKKNLLSQTFRFYGFFILLGVVSEIFIAFKIFSLW